MMRAMAPGVSAPGLTPEPPGARSAGAGAAWGLVAAETGAANRGRTPAAAPPPPAAPAAPAAPAPAVSLAALRALGAGTPCRIRRTRTR